MNRFIMIVFFVAMVQGCTSVPDKSEIDIILEETRGHPSAAGPNLELTDKFVIMDFEDTQIHDKAWFSSQPKGYTGFFVQGKTDSGVNKLSVAIGEGRNGSNALLVESTDESMGLPGFWIIKALNAGYASRLKDKRGYMLPSNLKANRLEFWLRFEKGFRSKKASAFPPKYPNHQNLHVGTYQFDPTKIDGVKAVVESNNWHFYHQVFLRHDKAGDDWIHVVVNQQPQHQRHIKGSLPNNPTMPAGNYFELLTRLYIDLHPYFSDPEIPYPIKMWVDDVTLSYVPESPDVTIDFLDYSQGETINVQNNQESLFPIRVTNNKSTGVCGIFSINAPPYFNPKLQGFDITKTKCLDANSSEILNLKFLPDATRPIDETVHAGLTFVNEEIIQSDENSTNRCLTDGNVEKRLFPETGAHDSNVSSNFVKLKIASNTLRKALNSSTTNTASSGISNKIPADFMPTEKFVIMDFEDSQIHDKAWFLSQPKGYTGFFVQGKTNSGVNQLSVAIGEGRNGGNALLVESVDESMGLPGFWIMKSLNKGFAAKLKDKEGYFLPSNMKANRLEFWLRFEKGFRSNKASALPPKYPNHQNLHVGTYQFDPTKIDGKKSVVKSDNWHFYHQVFLRHDKAGEDWIHIIVNQLPQRQRSVKATLPNNPTMPAGNYFELLTRLYIDLVPYFSDPEILYPIKMWVDDVALSYVPGNPDLTIDFLDHSQGDMINVNRNQESLFPVKITNNKSIEVCGVLSVNNPKYFSANLFGQGGDDIPETICLDANASEILSLKIFPDSTLPIGKTAYAGLTFVNEQTILSDENSTNRSLTDNNIEKRWFPETGAHDNIVSSNFIRVKIE